MNSTKSLLLTGVRAAFFGAVALGAASAMAWTAAPANPPASNVAAPLNIGATEQSKAGILRLMGNTSSAGGWQYAGLEVRGTGTAWPRMAFHMPGVVASQIGMDSAGTIRTFDNPGSGFAKFSAGPINANGGGYAVDLARGDSWTVVTGGNVYASDVYSSAAGKWLSDTGTFLGVVAAPYASPDFTATVPAGATYALVSIDGTVHGGGGDQSVASGKIYIDLVGQKSTGTYTYTTDCTVSAWTAASFGTPITVCGRTTFGYSQTNMVSLSGSTLTIRLPSEKGAAFFQFYK